MSLPYVMWFSFSSWRRSSLGAPGESASSQHPRCWAEADFLTCSRRPSAAAGCARLASLAVLAGQHRTTSSDGSHLTIARWARPTSTAGIEGGGVARARHRSSSRSPRRYQPERTTVTGCAASCQRGDPAVSSLRPRSAQQAEAPRGAPTRCTRRAHTHRATRGAEGSRGCRHEPQRLQNQRFSAAENPRGPLERPLPWKCSTS